MTTRNRWRMGLLCVAAVGIAIGLGACGGSDDEGPAETSGAGTTSTSPTSAGDTGTTTQATAGDVTAGEGVFAANCAGCHGPEGTGGNGGPDLTRIAKAGDVEQVIAQVTNGGGGMPPFGDQLDPTQIRDVAAYVTQVVHGGP